LLIAVGHEVLVEAPRLQRLAQGEEVFLAPVSSQGFGDFRLALLATIVAQTGGRLGVALSGDDGIEDGQPGVASDVGDGVVFGCGWNIPTATARRVSLHEYSLMRGRPGLCPASHQFHARPSAQSSHSSKVAAPCHPSKEKRSRVVRLIGILGKNPERWP